MKPRARISSLSALVAAATACAFVQTAVAHTAPSITEAAGTAHGRWRKVADGSISDRGVIAAEAAGFSRDRRSVIVTRTGLEDLDVQRVSLQSGRARNLMLEAFHPTVEIDMQAAYEPESNRLLLLSRVGFGGPHQLGWSSVLG